MIHGFKEFLLRGNILDLAVAVVIGLAFQSVITALTDHVVYPVISAFGGAEANGLTWQLTANQATTLDFGALASALVHFLIVAAAVYFLVVLPVNRLRSREQRDEAEQLEENTVLLREIRDQLTSNAAASTRSSDASGGDASGGQHRA